MKTKTLTQQVYDLLVKVPAGKVTTYKELGRALDTKAYRAIGQILRTNPQAPQVPCHRVVNASGKIGGYMGATSGPKLAKKIRLLKTEGVHVKNGQVVDFSQSLYHFK